MAKENIKKIIADAENVKPIADFNGIKITTFEDGATLRKADAIDDEPDISGRLMNADGTVARSNTKYASINPKKMFANRYRYVIKDKGTEKERKVLQVVTDKRAISEQNTGNIYVKRVPVYEIERDSKTKELVVTGITNVLDTEFMSEFNESLSIQVMIDVEIAKELYGAEAPDIDKLEI